MFAIIVVIAELIWVGASYAAVRYENRVLFIGSSALTLLMPSYVILVIVHFAQQPHSYTGAENTVVKIIVLSCLAILNRVCVTGVGVIVYRNFETGVKTRVLDKPDILSVVSPQPASPQQPTVSATDSVAAPRLQWAQQHGTAASDYDGPTLTGTVTSQDVIAARGHSSSRGGGDGGGGGVVNDATLDISS